ncbi:MAG: phospho-N-acetylmuramoyl-pentapeptide-transferase [Candidatus Dependentiae bacterium]|nr:phospho-N-acetylmuramoyl-pentapeptide-transferase [Candidatus Dependentiae bacterium]
MLYHISLHLKQCAPFFNVFHYISVRAVTSLLTALIFSFIFGDWFIAMSKRFFRSKAREWTPENHRKKDDMPTMGGLFILMVVVGSVLVWCNLADVRIWIFLWCLLGFGAIGFWDDWNKIQKKKGISAALKFNLQCFVAGVTGLLLYATQVVDTTIVFPFFKNLQPDIGLLFIPWVMFILVGTSNAVNLTDGLDGLAIGALVQNFATFSLVCYLAGHAVIASYLHIPFAGCAELTVLGSILVGASLGFLWYNTYPAQIFMGDVGALALGGGLALMAIMAKQEMLLPIAGGLFMLETVSVMLQVLSYRYLGRRLFRMAPIHHHFELLGWPEAKITVRFGIISLILCLLAIVTLKLR